MIESDVLVIFDLFLLLLWVEVVFVVVGVFFIVLCFVGLYGLGCLLGWFLVGWMEVGEGSVLVNFVYFDDCVGVV